MRSFMLPLVLRSPFAWMLCAWHQLKAICSLAPSWLATISSMLRMECWPMLIDFYQSSAQKWLRHLLAPRSEAWLSRHRPSFQLSYNSFISHYVALPCHSRLFYAMLLYFSISGTAGEASRFSPSLQASGRAPAQRLPELLLGSC